MRRAKYAATFVCVVLAVVSAFFWYRSTTTATDACIVYLSPTRSVLFVTDDAALFVYLETRQTPIRPYEWSQTSCINCDSRYRIGENFWAPPRFGTTPLGLSFGRDQRQVLATHVWDAGGRIALPLLVGAFLIVPAARVYRALRRRRGSAKLPGDLGQHRLDA